MRFALSIVACAAFFATPAASIDTSHVSVADGQVTTLHLRVEGIACDACSKRLREALNKLDGIVAVDVDRARGDLAVAFDPARTNEQAIRSEVTRHGFTVK